MFYVEGYSPATFEIRDYLRKKKKFATYSTTFILFLWSPNSAFYEIKRGRKSHDTIPLKILNHCHLDANSRGGDGWKHRDLVAQLSPESAAPEGIEPELKPRNSVGVDQRFAAKKTWKNK